MQAINQRTGVAISSGQMPCLCGMARRACGAIAARGIAGARSGTRSPRLPTGQSACAVQPARWPPADGRQSLFLDGAPL